MRLPEVGQEGAAALIDVQPSCCYISSSNVCLRLLCSVVRDLLFRHCYNGADFWPL